MLPCLAHSSFSKCSLGFPDSSDSKESFCNAGYVDSIPGSGREWQPTVSSLPLLPSSFCLYKKKKKILVIQTPYQKSVSLKYGCLLKEESNSNEACPIEIPSRTHKDGNRDPSRTHKNGLQLAYSFLIYKWVILKC